MLLLLQLPVFGAALLHGLTVPTADEGAVRGVLRRLPQWINEHVVGFTIEQNLGLVDDGARILPSNGGIFVQGGSGTTVLYAINYYLRNYCQTQITWDGNTYGERCEPLLEELYFEAPNVRYFGNPCTFSYSFVWWKWEEWEVFIDWLALNGFNMVLAPIGQEAIWRDIFLEMGLDRRDLNSYFTGPAYLAWHRMGNLKGYGGPVSDLFLDAQLELNKKIVARMVSLGIIPVLPTFAGFVPDALVHLHPEKKAWEKQFVQNTCWDGFNSTYSCLASVQPLEDLFTDIGTRFIKKQKEAYGQLFHVYSADPLNEIPRQLHDYKYLKDLAWSVHAACATGDNKCIWVLQSWSFAYDGWPKQAVKAFLSGVPLGRLLVLDLFAEHYPLWSHLKSFYGHPFVWSMLHNFGGNTEIRGNLKHPNKHYQITMTSGTTMVGGGLTMEGIQQNYMVYQFMIDRIWSNRMINIDKWVETFVTSRYQTKNDTIIEAWKIIAHTFYAQPLNKTEITRNGNRFESFILKRPKLKDIGIKYWFNMENLIEIVERFQAVKGLLWDNLLFRMDYNDFVKEWMQFKMGNDYIMRILEAVGIRDDKMRNQACMLVQDSFVNITAVANYDYDAWEAAAQSWAADSDEEKNFAKNARSLVSIWGPKGENLDYAHRSWKGLLTKYYAPRWKFLCAWMANDNKRWNNETAFNIAIFEKVESQFVSQGRGDRFVNGLL